MTRGDPSPETSRVGKGGQKRGKMFLSLTHYKTGLCVLGESKPFRQALRCTRFMVFFFSWNSFFFPSLCIYDAKLYYTFVKWECVLHFWRWTVSDIEVRWWFLYEKWTPVGGSSRDFAGKARPCVTHVAWTQTPLSKLRWETTAAVVRCMIHRGCPRQGQGEVLLNQGNWSYYHLYLWGAVSVLQCIGLVCLLHLLL
jgi:hypothetical protein